MAVERLGSILKHLSPGSPLSAITSKNADDIVITLAIRTPLAKARKGGFKDSSVEYLAYAILKEVKERSNLDPALVEDICMGNVRNAVPSLTFCICSPSANRIASPFRSRMASLPTSSAPPPSRPASRTRRAPTASTASARRASRPPPTSPTPFRLATSRSVSPWASSP